MKNAVLDEQQRELDIAGICEDILKNSRIELYLNMRFLDQALSSLIWTGAKDVQLAAIDGQYLFYQSEDLIQLFKKSREAVNRMYLHMILHCIFLHVIPKAETNAEYWNLACDVTVESIIDGLYLKCVHLPVSAVRRQAMELLCEKGKTVTAQRVYDRLEKLQLPDKKMREFIQEFCIDDHKKWYEHAPKHPKTKQLRNYWQDIRSKMQTEMETFSKEAAKDTQSLMEQLVIENQHRYDYKEFLRKFSVLKEEMKVDMDSFDYIFYNYGMERYGNMPLIEPLETKEEGKVEDFVIVIDTSMSCKGELVQKFLEETYAILSERESFCRRIHVHIIQCDEKVQSDVTIESLEHLKRYMQNFTVIGQGGTDFRPPFVYVEKLMSQKKFAKLRGLIYFTDGYGTFPAKMPPYETAFVFMKEDYRDVDVPPWAIKLILNEKEIGGSQR